MVDIAESVLARLKNRAVETGRSHQLCLQLFCQEEFLRRLQHSRYVENFILKGGLFIYAITNFESRVTMDIDFLLQNIPNTPEKLESILNEIITTNTCNDFIIYEIARIELIALMKKYIGLKAVIITKIKNTRTTFSIDFSFGDVVVPKQKKRKIPTQLSDFNAPEINTYSIETTLAEKLDAILMLMEYSSRMKDYYDIFYISLKFDLDGSILQDAISQTFTNRNRNFTIDRFDKLIALGNDVLMKKKWIAFIKKIKGSNIDFDDILKVFNIFLREIVFTTLKKEPFTKTWSASGGLWL